MPTDPSKIDDSQKKRLAKLFEGDKLLGVIPNKPSSDSLKPDEDPNKPSLWSRLKSKKVLVILVVLVVFAGAGALLASKSPRTTQTRNVEVVKTANANKDLSSPAGFIRGIESKKQGRVLFKVGEESYNTNYFIEDNQLYLELIPNAKIINKYLLQLANKGLDAAEQVQDGSENTAQFSAGKYVRFGYGSLYGIDGLDRYNSFDLASLYLPLASGDMDIKALRTGNESVQQRLTASLQRPTCKPAALDVKNYISDSRLNTGLFTPADHAVELTPSESKFALDNSKLDQLAAKLRSYANACLLDDSSAAESDRATYEGIIKRYENLPKVTITVKNTVPKHELIIRSGPDNKPLAINMIFDPLSAPSQPYEKQTSLNDRLGNQVVKFALAYEKCRFTPVAASDLTTSYHYFFSEKDYTYPSQLDSIYACSTRDPSLKAYKPPADLQLVLGPDRAATISNAGAENILQKYHDISYYIENFNLKNSRYPSLEEILANKVEGLDQSLYTDPSGKTIGQGDLLYELLPEGCVENCQDYKIQAKIFIAQLNTTITAMHLAFLSQNEK